MMRRGHTSGCCLFFLVTMISGVHQPRTDSPVQSVSNFELHSQSHINRPVLQPFESKPPVGTYTVKNLAGKSCINATTGVVYIVIEKKRIWYFSLDPSRIITHGYCDKDVAVLSLTLQDNTAGLALTFTKEKEAFYVTKLTAHLSPQPFCQRCANMTFSGLLDHVKLFKTANGQRFKCRSENLLVISSELRIKLIPLQMGVFALQSGHNDNEMECWADFNKRVVPIAIEATAVGLILIALLTFLSLKDRRRQGYDRL